MNEEKWFVSNKKGNFNDVANRFHISIVTARLLRNRELVTEDEIDSFLNGGLEDLADPLLLKDMKKTSEILIQKIEERKKIRVLSDYDADGCCSGYLLNTALSRCGADVDYDIPDRIHDGYGINDRLVKEAHEQGIDTIITCDNGISALSAVGCAKQLGMTMIITDHHEVPFKEEEGIRHYIMPKADAVLNPKQPGDEYPFKQLCGAGVVFKLIQVLYGHYNVDKSDLHKLIQFVAIATVCDIVDLQGENRILVKYGLKVLRKTDNLGLRALVEENGLDFDTLNYYHIGFVIGPSINASGRLDTAKKAVELLSAKTQEYAVQIARLLKSLNDSRKEMTINATESAIALVENSELKNKKVLVVYLDCHESIAGIVAGRVREKFNRPVFVITTTEEEGILKASGRSVEAYHMFEALMNVSDILEKFGGHPMAAGLSIRAENLELFKKRLNDNCELSLVELRDKITIDLQLSLEGISETLIDEILKLEPFGKANKKPLFAEKGLIVTKSVILGKNKNVLKMRVVGEKGTAVDALFFGDIPGFISYLKQKWGESEVDKLFRGIQNRIRLDLIYFPSVNEYNGFRNIQITIQHYR